MDYEFVGSFSDDEKRRVEDALSQIDQIEGTRLLGTAPHWAIFNATWGGVPFYMAMSHRVARGRQGHSFHGSTVGELVEAIYARASENAT